MGRTLFHICSEAVFEVDQETWLSVASDCDHVELQAVKNAEVFGLDLYNLES